VLVSRPGLRKRLIGLVVLGLLVSFAAGNLTLVSAADITTGSTLTTSPVTTILSVRPGASVSTQLQLQNSGTKAVTISVKLEKFTADGDNGQSRVSPLAPEDEYGSWVSFSRNTFVAEPGVWNQITMTINPPSTAALGYYYAVVFSPSATTNTNGATYTIKGANAILVLLDAHIDNEKKELKINSFISDKKSYQYLPATFKISVHNSGNIYTAPEGEVFISRTPKGTAIAALPINSGQGNILPGTDRTFSLTWDDGFPSYQTVRASGQIVSDKNGKPVSKLKWDIGKLSKFRFGRYYARLVLVYNNGVQDIPVNAVVSFWVIPWFMLFITLIVLVIAGVGIWTVVRALGRRLKTLRRS
jgi:hypothetical protein